MPVQAFLPQLGADRSLEGPPGRILNMSSISGRYSAPFVGAYCASKHALEGMSDSLRRELMLFGIDVIVIGMHTFEYALNFSAQLLSPCHKTGYSLTCIGGNILLLMAWGLDNVGHVLC